MVLAQHGPLPQWKTKAAHGRCWVLTQRAEEEIPLSLWWFSIIKPVRVTPNKIHQEKSSTAIPFLILHSSPCTSLFPRAGAGSLEKGGYWYGKGMGSYGNSYFHICRASRLGQKPSASAMPLRRGGKDPAKESTLWESTQEQTEIPKPPAQPWRATSHSKWIGWFWNVLI